MTRWPEWPEIKDAANGGSVFSTASPDHRRDTDWLVQELGLCNPETIHTACKVGLPHNVQKLSKDYEMLHFCDT